MSALKFELDRRQGVLNIGYGAGSSPSFTNLTVTNTLTVGGSVHGANGSFTNPSFAFNSDQNTGLYRIGPDNIGVTVGGGKVLDIATTGLTVTGALGASSLTSPAATNLTLAGGSGNTNVVLTPSGTGNVLTGRIVGVGVSPVSTSWDTTNGRGVQFGLYAAISESDTSGALSFLSNAVLATAADETGGAAYKRMVDGAASRIRNTFGTLTIDTAVSSTPGSNIAWVNQFTVNSAGVSIASTTAGASNAGALVVAGGISAGNTGSAASYFGGNVTVAGTGVSTIGASGARVLVNGATDDTSTSLQVSGNSSLGSISLQAGPTTYANYKMTFTAQAADEAYIVNFGGYKMLTGEGFNTPEITKLYSNNTLALTLSSTQAATFAGAVTTGAAITTSAPTGGAGAWELGIANTVSPTSPNRTITIEIGGTVYYLAAKTTND